MYVGKEMIPVLECESRFRQFDENGEPLMSDTQDVGISQINEIWWAEAEELGLDIFNSLDDNLKMARIIKEKQGIKAWSCYNLQQEPEPPQLDYTPYSCVEYARLWAGGHPDFRGNADQIQPNSAYGQVGFAVLTTENLPHVAIIKDETETEWILAEANYEGDGTVQHGRRLAKDSPKIRGYFNFNI